PPLTAQKARDEWGTQKIGEREDFRGLPIATIDGETARDFDDAVLVRALPNGNTELQVHIADVSWYVRPGSALDTEARVRGTSVYFPDRAVPMLPHALSSGMCSLLPKEDRLVLSCVMEIDARGEVVGYRVCEGLICSVRRCTYTSVQACLNAGGDGWNSGISGEKQTFGLKPSVSDVVMKPEAKASGYRSVSGIARKVLRDPKDDEGTFAQHKDDGDGNAGPSAALRDDRKKSNSNSKSEKQVLRDAQDDRFEGDRVSRVTPEPTAEDIAERERVELESPGMPKAFDRMLELALRLNAKRVRRGSIDFDLPEPVVEFDPDGNMKAIVKSERGWAHRLIEEFMLSANECVATWLESQGIASIYRIHEMPDPKRILDFEESASQFGQTLGIGSLPVKKFSMASERRTSRHKSPPLMSQKARHEWGTQGHGQKHKIPESLPVTPQMYQKLVRKIAGSPEERILAYLMLRSLKQARYSEKNEGHFALASPCYTHFTSPIRRSPDLIVHRLMRAMLRDGVDPRGGAISSTDQQPWGAQTFEARREDSRSPSRMTERKAKAGAKAEAKATRTRTLHDGPMAAEELSDIAVESSQAERRAADAERELMEWKKVKFMADKIGDDFHAVILSVTKY
ncbi:MAG: RNB domain-containing ribonuclease, partial [Bryocella sp.]